MCQICDTNYGNTRENSGNAGKVNQYILTDTADLPGYRFRISPPPQSQYAVIACIML
jgi:hypothetical protein